MLRHFLVKTNVVALSMKLITLMFLNISKNRNGSAFKEKTVNKRFERQSTVGEINVWETAHSHFEAINGDSLTV